MSDEKTRAGGPRRSRLAESLLPGGEEPDPRFSLANERTFLAWIRTSLAVTAGGLGVEAFGATIFHETWRKILAIGLLTMGVILAASAVQRWLNVERAMRHKEPLPIPFLLPFLAFTAAAGAVVMIVIILER